MLFCTCLHYTRSRAFTSSFPYAFLITSFFSAFCTFCACRTLSKHEVTCEALFRHGSKHDRTGQDSGQDGTVEGVEGERRDWSGGGGGRDRGGLHALFCCTALFPPPSPSHPLPLFTSPSPSPCISFMYAGQTPPQATTLLMPGPATLWRSACRSGSRRCA